MSNQRIKDIISKLANTLWPWHELKSLRDEAGILRKAVEEANAKGERYSNSPFWYSRYAELKAKRIDVVASEKLFQDLVKAQDELREARERLEVVEKNNAVLVKTHKDLQETIGWAMQVNSELSVHVAGKRLVKAKEVSK